MKIAPKDARRGSALTLHPAPLQQHRQAIAASTQQIASIQITVHQPIAMPHRQHWQHLEQQQQNLIRTEPPLTLQQVVRDAVLPITHEPQRPIQFNQLAEARQLGMRQHLHL